ncbi:MAG TPA: tail fiber domain-containing protein [Bacteroidales bacterium]|nr:tail fiber domain-containing protein [Bacteroidales bacterium]
MITILNRTIPAASRSGCCFGLNAAITSSGSVFSGGASSATSQDLSMLTQSGSTNAAKLGVGTTTPYYRIHITGSGATATALHCYFPTALQQSNAVVMQGTNSAYFVAHSTNVEAAFGASVANVAFAGSLDNSPFELRTSNTKRVCLTDTCTYITTPLNVCTSVVSPLVCGSTCVKTPLTCTTDLKVAGYQSINSAYLGDARLSIGGNTRTTGDIQTNDFVSDPLTGQGWCAGSTGDAEFQNLKVNCAMYAKEFTVDKIKNVTDWIIGNGAVCAVSGITYDSSKNRFYFTVHEDSRYYAQPDDGLWSLQTNSNGVHSCFLRAYSGDSSTCRVYVCENWNKSKCSTGIALNNVSACYFCFIEPPGQFYSVASCQAGQYVQSNAFSATGGTLNLNHCIQINTGNVAVALYDCSNNLVCNMGTVSSSTMFNCTVQIANTCSYRYRYTMGTSNTNIMPYKVNISNTYQANMPDVSGWLFALWGNKSNPSRGNLIYGTGTQQGAPKLEFYTNVTGQTINATNKKTILNAEGLTACNANLIDANVSGVVCAGSGCIGDVWTINSAGITDGFIDIDGSTHTISVKDVNGVERININNGCLSPLANLLCGSSLCIPESCATGADLRIDRCAGTTSCTIYFQELTAGNSTTMTDYTSCQASKNFPTCAGNMYTVGFNRWFSTAYSLNANTCTDNGDTYTCKTYSLAGNYKFCGSTCVLDNANNLLSCRTWSTGDKTPYSTFAACRQCSVQLYGVFNNSTGGTGVYLKTTYSLVNNVSQTECFQVYHRDPEYLIYSNSSNCPLLLCTNSEIDLFCYNSSIGKAEIRNNGIQLAYAAGTYLRFDNSKLCVNATTVFDCSIINICNGSNFNICNSSLDVTNSSASGYAAEFCNTSCAATSFGILVRSGCANETTCIYTLRAYNNAGTELGGLANSTGGAFAVYTLSDCNKKCCIQPATIDALTVLQAVPVSEYAWKSDKDANKHTGYIAQDVMGKGVEGLAGQTPEGDYFISPTALIPHMHRAIQQLTACIKKLEGQKC